MHDLHGWFRTIALSGVFVWGNLRGLVKSESPKFGPKPVLSISVVYTDRKLDTENRFEYANNDGLVHVWLASSGNRALTACELLELLDSDSVIGFGRFLKSMLAPPSNVYTVLGWLGYFERQYQWLVKQRVFKQREEVNIFQHKTGGWCYITLISASPCQASKLTATNGMTMGWEHTIPLARAASKMDVPFALSQTSPQTTHISMSLGGTWTVTIMEWVLKNPSQATPQQCQIVGAVLSGFRFYPAKFL
ncbi:hypothetical protein DFH07DRAFT_772781 [Mycena maculata]|uniref:Uncharacterized protein n=1 Tax=Mycena maculata TaxID=230809 RepID=A0AAD7J5X1_9AGAR|nr:hypothetical protein DFH07DRAFT_772781 [Mycena maculata]